MLVREQAAVIGGGTRTEQVTLPGYAHDICSAVHPMAATSPLFRGLPLSEHGLDWITPSVLLAHPFDNGAAATLERSVDDTARHLGDDSSAYRGLMSPFLEHWNDIVTTAMHRPFHMPKHPLLMARFGSLALRSANSIVQRSFKADTTRALFAGVAAHCMLPLNSTGTAGFGLMLSLAGHAAGWPIARGGSVTISNALASYLRALGGVIETDAPVNDISELPPARAILLDVTPRQLLRIARGVTAQRYARRIARYRYGHAAYKIDWALSERVPWANPRCRDAVVVHLVGSYNELVASEQAVSDNSHSRNIFVLFVQPTTFDTTRAPDGKHVGWAYCHVPNGSTRDYTARIEAQIERFAPGFRDTILKRAVMSPACLESHNPNLIGGDINGGSLDLLQYLFRPVASRNPYVVPTNLIPDLYLCSAATPPGGGVHGMCGYNAAITALQLTFGVSKRRRVV